MSDFPIPIPTPTPEVKPVVNTTRYDLDNLIARIADLLAKGDGIEPGFTTTEFWLAVLALVSDLAGPSIGLSIPANERMYLAVVIVGMYGAFRSWRKRGGPAALYAALLARLAELRRATA